MSPLTTPQREQIEAVLRQRQAALDQQRAEHQGQGRVAMAAEWLAEDTHDRRERDADREVALAQADRELEELGRVSAALRRLAAPDFGLCGGCGEAIRFERLLAEPWTPHCTACASAAEIGRAHV